MRRSSAYPWTYLESLIAGYAHRQAFADVRAFVMFIGQPRSGTSLVGSLLNAHRHSCIAQELNALRYVRRGYRRRQLYWLLLAKDREFGHHGRHWTGYDYTVPGQWQGRCEQLLVIGDKKAGCSTEQLGADPQLLRRLQQLVRVPVRLIHLVRNPFNVIATIHRKRPRTSLELATRMYFDRCQVNGRLVTQHPQQILTLRLEDLLADPAHQLRQLCQFVELEPQADYLAACTKVLFDKPRQSQRRIAWPPDLIDSVCRQMTPFPFLRGYGPLEMHRKAA